MPQPIYIPLLNPNEPEACLAILHIREGQHVMKGDVICTIETTKSTADVLAETEGYVVGLRLEAGQIVTAGETLCYLADEPTWAPPDEPIRYPETGQEQIALPEGLRITQPAMELARQHGLDLSQLPKGHLVTAELVRSLLENQKGELNLTLLESSFDPTAIIVYGGGGHGKSLIDLLRSLGGYRIIGIVDDGVKPGEPIMGLPVLGGGEILPELHAQGVRLAVNAVGGIGNLAIRIKVFKKLSEAGFTFPTLIHPTAFVEASATLSPGVHVFPHAYVGSEARVGFACIVNTGAIVSHDCILGDYTNISPGALLAGGVQIGRGVLIGMGASINLQVKIGSGARIGNGATVKEDVPEKGMVRAGAVWPEN